MENGINVLTKIKEYNPVLPIIMFTASTKATNMDSIYELGVDGYFVKEHPDARNDGNFSKKNLESFVNTTYNCFEKGVLLKSYWVRTQKIRKNNTIREQLISVNRTTELTKFGDRIPERLEMFVGIMKKAFEQTSFDKTTFYYDQYETAFLTLWSSLNDLVAAYYERNTTTSHRNFQWKDKFTGQIYVDFVGGNMVSPLVYDTNNSPYFSVTTDSNGNLSQIVTPPKVNYQTTLSNQIAFLLYSICEKYGIDLQEKDKYYKILKEANDIRNSLWLTHSELLSTNYLNNFKRTLKTDRVAGNKNEAFWRKEILKLFSLIEFIVSEK
jgi:CheY-like chemotaxis protein